MDLRIGNLLGIPAQRVLVCCGSASPHRSRTHIGKYFSDSVDQSSTSEIYIFDPYRLYDFISIPTFLSMTFPLRQASLA